ncbi:hypothetical protein [Nocardiopsis sp. HUAS JQ3]|uniref:hypothetical protein n=1 Tax=Nocardiopsis sp. HUAS JQ3 TaxID=3061629 RepID=UPI0023A9620A|nr:hypothetical protein [Nocardiopsis sp. HUAS JQ3]WDZ93286.1 hypothetical protein PV789_12445 [Nocardiopsis sp. HUAS JQ3]
MGGQAPEGGDPAVEHLAATLRRRREELAGAGGVRIGSALVVHALATHMWAGVPVPAVACHASVDPLRLRASAGPVTCRRCLAQSGQERQRQVPGQTELEV